jgi:hypothetical protein
MVLNKNPQERPTIGEILNYPLIKNHINNFISAQGKIAREEIIPLKKTKFHLEVHKEVLSQQPFEDSGPTVRSQSIGTVQSLELSQSQDPLSTKDRLLLRKKREAQKREEELKEAAIKNLCESRNVARQRKEQEIWGQTQPRGHDTLVSQKKASPLEEHSRTRPSKRHIIDLDPPTPISSPTPTIIDERPIKGTGTGKYNLDNLAEYNDAAEEEYYADDFEEYHEADDERFRIKPLVDQREIITQALNEYTCCLTGELTQPATSSSSSSLDQQLSLMLEENRRLRESCVSSLGEASFNRMYDFVKEMKGSGINGDRIKSEFKENFGKLSFPYYFKIEEILYFEG